MVLTGFGKHRSEPRAPQTKKPQTGGKPPAFKSGLCAAGGGERGVGVGGGRGGGEEERSDVSDGGAEREGNITKSQYRNQLFQFLFLYYSCLKK